jgi:MFS family permease
VYSIFGRILPGLFADHYGRYNTMIFVNTISAIFVLAVWIPVKNTAGIIVFVIIFGFSSGGFISLSAPIVAQITPDLRQVGTRLGAIMACQAVGALIGSPIGGAIVSAQDGDYLGLQLFCGLVMALSVVVLLTVRWLQQGFKFTKV